MAYGLNTHTDDLPSIRIHASCNNCGKNHDNHDVEIIECQNINTMVNEKYYIIESRCMSCGYDDKKKLSETMFKIAYGESLETDRRPPDPYL